MVINLHPNRILSRQYPITAEYCHKMTGAQIFPFNDFSDYVQKASSFKASFLIMHEPCTERSRIAEL
jgi:hypothetical protein